jgi:hypothetical protein
MISAGVYSFPVKYLSRIHSQLFSLVVMTEVDQSTLPACPVCLQAGGVAAQAGILT